MSCANELSGIGYQGRSVDDLITELERRGVTVLADVRLNALSRKPGFSKRALSTALERAGIRYVHLRSLGNERDNRAGYAETDTAAGDSARDRYRAGLSGPEASEALAYLESVSDSEKVAVFCFEADEAHCHRQQVLTAMSARRREAISV
jgi:uncharacterized protein (DUF488 family)